MTTTRIGTGLWASLGICVVAGLHVLAVWTFIEAFLTSDGEKGGALLFGAMLMEVCALALSVPVLWLTWRWHKRRRVRGVHGQHDLP